MNREPQGFSRLAAAIDDFNRGTTTISYRVPSEIMVKVVRSDCRAAVYEHAAREFSGKRLLTFASWLPPRYFDMFVGVMNERLERLEGKPGTIAALERGELVMALKGIRYENAFVYDRIDKVLERFTSAVEALSHHVSLSDPIFMSRRA